MPYDNLPEWLLYVLLVIAFLGGVLGICRILAECITIYAEKASGSKKELYEDYDFCFEDVFKDFKKNKYTAWKESLRKQYKSRLKDENFYHCLLEYLNIKKTIKETLGIVIIPSEVAFITG